MMDQAVRLRNLMENKKTTKDFKFNSRLITVASGKGGVGKSNFTLNLAINLASHGKSVAIIDADFGMANIEVLYGKVPSKSLANVLRGENTIEEIITQAPGGISLVSGGSGITDLANLSDSQVEFLMESFVYLDEKYDIILIDTGAGASDKVTSMVKAAGEAIILTTPEPTALTDAYALIKILKTLETIPEMYIVINRTMDKTEGEEIYFKLNRVSHRFLGLDLKLLGYIPDDNHLRKAVRKQEPVSIAFPKSDAAKSIAAIAREILAVDSPVIKNEDATGGFLRRFTGLFGK